MLILRAKWLLLPYAGSHDRHRDRWEVSMNLKRVITWAIVVFIIYYLATNPTGADHVMHTTLNGLKSAGNSLSNFVSRL